ncbi:MAG: NAD(P)/FAD-dependent oxidoreductase [Candidatus Cloacimonas sp.]|jgi:phytoene dehydrogenase-like protein|nr:NAD(P)/FAD-dependent oxidoreductase [Candidatus Cloacimonas sp.]
MIDHIYDTIVVGGGIAGLTATAYLAREGQKVLLLEKNRDLGGLVNSFSLDGFHIDAGVRALEDAGIILTMLKDLQIKLEVVKSPVSLGIENEILRIEDVESLSEYSCLLKKFYPESGEDINKLIKSIRQIMKYMDVLYGIENPLFKDLKRDTSFIFKTLLPWLPRFLFTIGKINRMQYPVEDYLESVITNLSLRNIVSQHFFEKTPAFFAMSYFSLYLDYFYPKGGVGKLSEAMKDKILELGGEIKTETIVTSVAPADNTLTDSKNASYTYKKLIWAADLKTLYRIAKVQNLPVKMKANYEAVKTNMLHHKGGESVVTLFLQINEPLESFSRISTGHFFYTPSRQGLGETHRKELQTLLHNFQDRSKEEVLAWLDRFISLNTYEISIPGLKDKDLAPPGKTGMIISLLAKFELFQKVQEAGWLEEFCSEFQKRVLRVISESVYPMLKDKVLDCYFFSPLSIHNRIASSEGAIVGWEFRKEMPVINKIQLADRSVFTPLPSVYQAGQWAYSPAGVPMAILTGKLAANKAIASLSPNIWNRLTRQKSK